MKGTAGRGELHKRRLGILTFARQGGFSVFELMAVISIIGLMLLVTTLAIYATSRRTDISAVAEMIKEDIRKMYALADSAITSPEPPNPTAKRDQYRMVFHNNSENDPPTTNNAYQLQKKTYDGITWGGWTAQTPATGMYANVVGTDNNWWIKPSMDTDCQIIRNFVSGANPYNYITFVSRGSVTNVCPEVSDEIPVYATQPMTITVRSISQDANIVITVTDRGNITSSQ